MKKIWFLVLIIMANMLFSTEVHATWWNESWAKKAQFNVTNDLNEVRTDAIVELNISKTYTKSDCSDIRMITGAENDEMENYNVTNTVGNCTIRWTTNLTASQVNQTVYVYYNYSGASSSTWPQTNELLFSDDFENSSYDNCDSSAFLNNWNIIWGTGSGYACSFNTVSGNKRIEFYEGTYGNGVGMNTTKNFARPTTSDYELIFTANMTPNVYSESVCYNYLYWSSMLFSNPSNRLSGVVHADADAGGTHIILVENGVFSKIWSSGTDCLSQGNTWRVTSTLNNTGESFRYKSTAVSRDIFMDVLNSSLSNGGYALTGLGQTPTAPANVSFDDVFIWTTQKNRNLTTVLGSAENSVVAVPWSNNQSSTPSSFNLNTLSKFNITWTSVYSIDEAIFEINLTGGTQNYSMGTNFGNNIYNFSIILPAGNYYWKSYANDTNNNWNSTGLWNFSIGKNTTTCTLFANGTASDRNYIFGQKANLTGTINIDPNIELNLSTNASFGQNFQTATAKSITNVSNTTTWNTTATFIKTYNWTVSFQGNENYTSCLATRLISIIDTDTPSYSNLITSPNSGTSYVLGASYKFNSTWTDNVEVDTVFLQFNNTNYTAGNKTDEYFVIINDTWAKSSGYSYKWFANDTSDNWATSSIQTYIIYDTPIWSTNATNLEDYYRPEGYSYFNITETIRNSTTIVDKVLLEINLSSGTRNFSMSNTYGGNIYDFNIILSAGNYQWKVFANDTYNQWNTSTIWYFSIAKNQTNPLHLNMSTNNFTTNSTDTSINVYSINTVNVSGWIEYPDSGNPILYIDGSLFTNPYSGTFSAGTHPVLVNTTGNENYTANATGATYSIISTMYVPASGGGGGAGPSPPQNITQIINVSGFCGDSVCDGLLGETTESCPLDCPVYQLGQWTQLELIIVFIAAAYIIYSRTKKSKKKAWEL